MTEERGNDEAGVADRTVETDAEEIRGIVGEAETRLGHGVVGTLPECLRGVLRFDAERAAQWHELEALVRKHSDRILLHRSGYLPYKVTSLIDDYERSAINAIAGVKAFRDELLTYLRAFDLIVEMVGNAATHHEKNARLRGLAELFQSVYSKLERENFDFRTVGWQFDGFGIFRSDYPTRAYQQKIDDLKAEIERLKAEHETKASESEDIPL